MAASVAWLCVTGAAAADDAASPGEVRPERPTLCCLGVRWTIGGDANRNARVRVKYRKTGDKPWREALDLFRVESRAILDPDRPAGNATLYAGSIFGLAEDTPYEVKLSLADPDGGSAQRTLSMRTAREPQLPRGRSIAVTPVTFAESLRRAAPGDTLRLASGTYGGPFAARSGAEGRPIAIVGQSDGSAVLDGNGKTVVLNACGLYDPLHDVMFENLTVQNGTYGIALNGAVRACVRRVTIRDVEYGIVATQNDPEQHSLYFLDNTIIGRSTWPRTKGIEDRRGIQVTGSGNVVAYNRVARFADGIDTFPGDFCSAIDIYGNDVSECTDDGCEMDYSRHNTRCFENRFTNVFQGISVQPVHGGPVYIFRNALYNVALETFKLHNGPSGAIFYHNTSVKSGMPLVLMTREAASNCVSRNNLFVGTEAAYAYENGAPMQDCDFDGDGFAGRWKLFLKWNGRRYATLEDAARSAPVYRRAVHVDADGLFASGVKAPADSARQFPLDVNDLRPAAGSGAIDAGVVLPNVNDGHGGKASDLGAYELDQPLPRYGPRGKRDPEAGSSRSTP